MHSARYHRARVRETRLRELGYDTYAAYLKSAAWRDVRRRYRESDLPQICMCGASKVQLHHTTYDRVGRELLEDLIPLCAPCHEQAHVLEAAGVIDLNLKGFYYDAELAKDGQMYLAQLKAACPDGEVLRADKRQAFEGWRADREAERRAMRRPAPWRPQLRVVPDGATNRAARQINDFNERQLRRLEDQQDRAARQSREARPEDLARRSFAP